METNKSVKLNESAENYLKAILVLYNKYGYVRSADVAEWLGVSRPSVSNAVNSLRNGGFILLDRHKMIRLTAMGREAAERVYDRHCVLTEFLISIGVAPETAEKDACKIEHDLSNESFERLKLDKNMFNAGENLVEAEEKPHCKSKYGFSC